MLHHLVTSWLLPHEMNELAPAEKEVQHHWPLLRSLPHRLQQPFWPQPRLAPHQHSRLASSTVDGVEPSAGLSSVYTPCSSSTSKGLGDCSEVESCSGGAGIALAPRLKRRVMKVEGFIFVGGLGGVVFVLGAFSRLCGLGVGVNVVRRAWL